jgi:hypothetical protein
VGQMSLLIVQKFLVLNVLMFCHTHFESNEIFLVEVFVLVVCDTASLCDRFLTFQDLMLVSFNGQKSDERKP